MAVAIIYPPSRALILRFLRDQVLDSAVRQLSVNALTEEIDRRILTAARGLSTAARLITPEALTEVDSSLDPEFVHELARDAAAAAGQGELNYQDVYVAALIAASAPSPAHAPEPEPEPRELTSSRALAEWLSTHQAESALWQTPAGAFVEAMRPETEADPRALFGQFLTVFGTMAGRHAYVVVGRGRQYPNINTCIVGPTAQGAKGVSWDDVAAFYRCIDPKFEDWIQRGASSGEGFIWAVRDPIPKYQPGKKGEPGADVIVDPGIVDKRALWLEDEFAGMLTLMGREGNSLSSVIRQAFNGGTLRTSTKNSPARSTGAHVSIIGHVTAHELRNKLTGVEAANGFGNRFLWLSVERSDNLLPHGGADVPMASLVLQVRKALEAAQRDRRVDWSPDASRLWASLYRILRQKELGMVGEMAARGPAIVTRLALVLTLLDGAQDIQPNHLLAAGQIWLWGRHSVEALFWNSSGDPLQDAVKEIIYRYPDEGLVTQEIYRELNGHVAAEHLHRVLDNLVRAGLVTRTRERSTGGRPAVRYWPAPQQPQSGLRSNEVSEESQGRREVRGIDSEVSPKFRPNSGVRDNSLSSPTQAPPRNGDGDESGILDDASFMNLTSNGGPPPAEDE